MSRERICTFEGCDRMRWCWGLCSCHAKAKKAGRPLVPLLPKRMKDGTAGTCRLPGCANKAKCQRLCATHYDKRRKGVVEWWRPTTRRSNVSSAELHVRPLESTWVEMKAEAEATGLTPTQVLHQVLDEWAYRRRNGGLAPGVPGERDEEPDEKDAWRRTGTQ